MQLPGITTIKSANWSAQSTTTFPWSRLGLILFPALAALVVAGFLIALQPAILLIAALVIGFGITAVALSDRKPSSDPILLVGKSPMAAVIASYIEQANPTKRVPVTRVANFSDALALTRTMPCREIVLVETDTPRDLDISNFAFRFWPAPRNWSSSSTVSPSSLPCRIDFCRAFEAIRPIDRTYAFIKRAIDIAVASAICLILAPILPIVALAIKLDSRGPILYSQTRVGQSGRTFRIYKFRTMRIDAEANGAVWATKRDPRITRVGGFMRKTRLDEIPQVWNLLRGDMALVGPRPERPEFTATLAEQIPAYDLRHTVKPGLTGWAQVCYRYTSSIRDTRAKVEYDLYYVKHCSPKMDLVIMLRTVKVVVAMKGQ